MEGDHSEITRSLFCSLMDKKSVGPEKSGHGRWCLPWEVMLQKAWFKAKDNTLASVLIPVGMINLYV
jgi:hypothetical protein